MKTALPALLALLLADPAAAHPYSKDEFSLAHALQLSESGLAAVVIVEVPIPVVLEQVQGRIDAGSAKKKALADHDQAQFDQLAAGLALQVNGKPVPVSWKPVEHPSNGKVADGFFTYWVGAKVSVPAGSAPVSVSLSNTAWPEVKMVYTGSAIGRDGWSVVSNSATSTLGLDVATADRTDPRAWGKDPSLRTLRVVFQR